jgi:hypothetical protein
MAYATFLFATDRECAHSSAESAHPGPAAAVVLIEQRYAAVRDRAVSCATTVEANESRNRYCELS